MAIDSKKPEDASNAVTRTPRDTALRHEREAAALRENLARRKAQSRARQPAATDPQEDPAACR